MPEPSYREWIATGLAHALLADSEAPGGTTPLALRARAAAALGQDAPWLTALVQAIGASAVRRLDLQALAARITQRAEFEAAFHGDETPRIRRLILRPARMAPCPPGLHALDLQALKLPALATHEDLADALGLAPERLAWLTAEAQHFRDPAGGRPAPAPHYRALLHPKPSGGWRLIEAPKPTLKLAQRRLLASVLNLVPPHEAAMAYVPGRSVREHAAAHTGQPVVLRFDLQDFFPSIHAARVQALWRTLGCPPGAARTLTALCTTRTPRALRDELLARGLVDWRGAKRLGAAHLPQGAPSSPALANLCCFRLDLRLAGLAASLDARYTRYADDLVFSGPPALRERLTAISAWVAGIAADEGFVLHPRKTRCLPQHRQQRITGVVVNRHVNLPREDFDRLKATLHHHRHHGPPDAAQRAELLGRIAWATQLNPARGARLMAQYRLIDPAAPATADQDAMRNS